MANKPWYELLFANYAEKYELEPFTQGTMGECDFLEKEFNFNHSLRILDVGCGTGRHSIELTRRGYTVTGIDLSMAQLAKAKEKAAAAGLTIDFQQQDARNLPFRNEFDAVIMLCEGGFSLMETDEMNFQILSGISFSLKPGGKVIFTNLNGLYPIFHSLEKFYDENASDGNSTCHSNSFDLMTFRDHNVTELEDDSGKKLTLHSNERYYIPSEITWLLKSVAFKTIDIYGAKLGAFSREDKLRTDDFEMLVIAEK